VSQQKPSKSVWSRYGYLWVTLALFGISITGHWVLGWYAFVDEQAQHAQSPEVTRYLVEIGRDTLENWQSEFLQLIWQVSGLAILYHVGSPQSKEGHDRLEEKVDRILRAVEQDGAKDIQQLDRIYQRD
jgi:hypothetical protein